MTRSIARARRWHDVARLGAALGALAAAGAMAACNEFLKAENPGAIQAENLGNASYITLMANGVQGEWQRSFPTYTYYASLWSDEIRNHHVFFEERLFDLRQVAPENGTYSFFVYVPMQRARFMADSVAGRLRALLGDSATRDLRLARSLAYGGYAYVVLGEDVCGTPINVSAPYGWDEMMKFALVRFDSAIAVAAAARAYQAGISPATTASTAAVAGADTVRNFALVGAARAALDLGDKARAIGYARQVSPGFEMRNYFSENSSGENNPFWGRFSTGSSGSNSASISNTPYEAMAGDPRVPRPATQEPMMDGLRAWNPNSPTAFNTYAGTPVGADFQKAGWLRIASYLEAQYILAEAQGPTPGNIEFLNSRAAVGGQPPLAATAPASDYLAFLRDQRRRDFFLDGHRMGDLRRYKRFYQIDEFPTGTYPGTTTGEVYGTQECWPLTLAEINGNPNVPKGNPGYGTNRIPRP